MASNAVDMPSYCSVQRVRKHIAKDLCKIRILELGVEIFYDFLGSGGRELAAVLVWTLER